MRLRSLRRGYHPATGLELPVVGETFEASAELGAQLVAAGLAELVEAAVAAVSEE